MGTACAPSYADIFAQKHIYLFIKDKVDLYLRYIDNIFFIWKDALEKLKNFFNAINKNDPSFQIL